MKNSIFIIFAILIVSCSAPTPRKPIVRKTSTFLKESIARNKVINQVEEQALQDYITNDSLNTYSTSPNGFWYRYITTDSISTRYPLKGDKVTYAYEIKDVNNSVLYSKEQLGERNYAVDREELISGLQDGIKLMKEGEEVVFLFPSYKAYGYAGYRFRMGITAQTSNATCARRTTAAESFHDSESPSQQSNHCQTAAGMTCMSIVREQGYR